MTNDKMFKMKEKWNEQYFDYKIREVQIIDYNLKKK